MYIVQVLIRVKLENIMDFQEATRINAENSLREEGIIRFDILQQQEDPQSFSLIEVYFTPEDQLKHRETTHFKNWRFAVGDMLEIPYSIKKYNNIFPDDSQWLKK